MDSLNDYFVFDAKTMDILREGYKDKAFFCSSDCKSVLVYEGTVVSLVSDVNNYLSVVLYSDRWKSMQTIAEFGHSVNSY